MQHSTFTKVPNKAIDDPALSGNDLRVLTAICRYAHNKSRKCHPSRATLMSAARISNKPLSESLLHLQERGYITVESRFHEGKQLSNEYWVRV